MTAQPLFDRSAIERALGRLGERLHRRGEHLLAMKAIAGRRYADREDLLLLVGMLGLSTVDEIERITNRVFPDEPLTARSRPLLEDVLEERHRPSP